MALTLRVELLADGYEASLGGDSREWPPHPARAYCALVSVAEPSSSDDDALRWLERQGPPAVLAGKSLSMSERSGFVPTNMLAAKGGHQVYPGRTSGARVWHRTVAEVREARFVWPAAAPSLEQLEALNGLAHRVGYLGRSTSPALLSFTAGAEEPGERLLEYAPSPDRSGALGLRVPYEGYLDDLRDLFAAGEPPWSAARTSWYRATEGAVEAEVKTQAHPPPFPEVLIFAFDPGDGIDGRHAPAVARAFKAAVLQRLGEQFDEDRLAPIHGHHDGSLRQCAFLSLPFVGAPHSTGEVLGVAIAVADGLAPDLHRELRRLAGLDRDPVAPRLEALYVPGLGRRRRLRPPDHRQTVRRDRWAGTAPAWASVYPIVLDWFPKRRLPVEEIVARGCEVAGLPRPQSVDVLPASLHHGAAHVPRRVLSRRNGDLVRPAVHVRLCFDRPVTGPILIGHLRHTGMGLCLPVDAS